MSAAKVSRKYQVVIPEGVREPMGIEPGQEMQVIQHDGRIELTPASPVGKMRGSVKGVDATAVKVSPKYQVVIPKEAREAMGAKPGQEVAIFPYNGRIEIIPVGPISELLGCLKGIDTTVERDEDRS